LLAPRRLLTAETMTEVSNTTRNTSYTISDRMRCLDRGVVRRHQASEMAYLDSRHPVGPNKERS
jgi:hypothetical protein